MTDKDYYEKRIGESGRLIDAHPLRTARTADPVGVDLFTFGVMYTIESLSFAPDPEDSAYILGECVVKGLGTWRAREKDKNVIMTKAVWCDD